MPNLRFLPRSDFGRNVLTMMAGTTVAQIIPLSVAPLLTRLYSPSEFGAFALFMALASVLSIPATGRYDLAVVLPERDTEAMSVATLCIATAVTFSIVLTILLHAFPEPIAKLIAHDEVPVWMYLLAPMISMLAINQALSNWLNRDKQYRMLVAGSIVLHGTTAITSLGLGLVRSVGQGLVWGRFAGQAAACGILSLLVCRNLRRRALVYRPEALMRVARRYWRFPLYSVPYGFVGNFSKEFPIIAFSIFGQFDAAGFFGLARNILYLPMGFVSSSLGQVFYKEAADHFGTRHLEALANRLMQQIAILFTPPFLLVAFWAPDLFEIAFGTAWREAGRYAALFAPAAYLYIFTGWTERLFLVADKQHVSLCLQISFDVLLIASLAALLDRGATPLVCVGTITAVSIFYHVTYLVAVYRAAGFKLHSLIKGLLPSTATILLLSGAIFLTQQLPIAKILQFAFTTMLAMIPYAFWLRHGRAT